MPFRLNNIVIESRAVDHFVNATQMCKAGGKQFSDWYAMIATKQLIQALEQILGTESTIPLVETKHGTDSWIHPDLTIRLASWISPAFAIQVSRWVRELMLMGSVSLESKRLNEESIAMQARLEEQLVIVAKLERRQLALDSFICNGARSTRKIDISNWTNEQVDAKIEEIVNLCCREQRPEYEFATHKDTIDIVVPWTALSTYLKTYDCPMNAWRERFKGWFAMQSPTKFKVRGIKTQP